MTAHLLYGLFGEHADRQFLDGKFRSELRCLLEYAQAAGRTSPERIDSHLEALITNAIDLDLIVQSTQHDIKVEMHDPITGKLWGFPALDDADIMFDENGNFNVAVYGRTLPVDMIRRPSIRILGQMCGTARNITRVHERRGYCGWGKPQIVASGIWGPREDEDGDQAPVGHTAVESDADAKTVAMEDEDTHGHSTEAASGQAKGVQTEADASIDEPDAQASRGPMVPNSKSKASVKRKRHCEGKARAGAHVEDPVEE
jgi:hypothetical protein